VKGIGAFAGADNQFVPVELISIRAGVGGFGGIRSIVKGLEQFISEEVASAVLVELIAPSSVTPRGGCDISDGI
jgi:hypothetical protein